MESNELCSAHGVENINQLSTERDYGLEKQPGKVQKRERPKGLLDDFAEIRHLIGYG